MSTMISVLAQLLYEKVPFIFRFFHSFFDIVKYVCTIPYSNTKDSSKSLKRDSAGSITSSENSAADCTDLFKQSSQYQHLKSTSANLRSCAVSEFDFTSTNPLNWDIQNLGFNTSNDYGHPNSHSNHFVNHSLQNPHSHSSKTQGTANVTTSFINTQSPATASNMSSQRFAPINGVRFDHNNNIINTIGNGNVTGRTGTGTGTGISHDFANNLLANFTENFKNQLETNEIPQLYQDAPSLVPHVQLINNEVKNQFVSASANNVSEDELEFSDDEFENVGHNKTVKDQEVIQNYGGAADFYENDYDDTLPLDDELMLSFIRNSNEDIYTQQNYNILNHLSAAVTKPPSLMSSRILTASTNGSSSPMKENQLKHDYDEINHHYDSFNKNKNEEETVTASHGENLGPQKKYRKLTSKKSSPVDASSNDDKSPDSLLSTGTSINSPLSVPSHSSLVKELDDEDKSLDDKNLFVCPICQTTFKVKGYLTRHKKKHFVSKPFQCPFFDPSCTFEAETGNEDEAHDHKSNAPRCHPTGGFSRRDTFKTHLKALHFVYPTGTKSTDRGDKSGRCAGCFKEFKSNKEWLETHVATNQCEGMITKYK